MRWNWCWWNITVFALSVFWVVVLASSFATPSGKCLNKIAENCTMKVPTRSGNKLKIGITVCKVAQTRYPCEGSACFGCTAFLQRNWPFASSHSRGTKPPYWRARDAPGEDKQRTNHANRFFCPSASFVLQHGSFVSREWQAAKGLLSHDRVCPCKYFSQWPTGIVFKM